MYTKCTCISKYTKCTCISKQGCESRWTMGHSLGWLTFYFWKVKRIWDPMKGNKTKLKNKIIHSYCQIFQWKQLSEIIQVCANEFWGVCKKTPEICGWSFWIQESKISPMVKISGRFSSWVSSSFLGKKEKKRIRTQSGDLEFIDFKIQKLRNEKSRNSCSVNDQGCGCIGTVDSRRNCVQSQN